MEDNSKIGSQYGTQQGPQLTTGRKELTEEELIFAANKFIRKTQFGSNQLE